VTFGPGPHVCGCMAATDVSPLAATIVPVLTATDFWRAPSAAADAEPTGAFAADWRRGGRVLVAKVRRVGGVRWAAAQSANA